jgi:hypothetical protein
VPSFPLEVASGAMRGSRAQRGRRRDPRTMVELIEYRLCPGSTQNPLSRLWSDPRGSAQPLSRCPRVAQRDARSNKVALNRLSSCCVFCKKARVPSVCQQASDVTRRASEAALLGIVSLLQSRCATRGADASRKTDPFRRARCPFALSACGEAFDGLYSLATSKFYLYSNTFHRISTILQAA